MLMLTPNPTDFSPSMKLTIENEVISNLTGTLPGTLPGTLEEFADFWHLTAKQQEQFGIYAKKLLSAQQSLNIIAKSTESTLWSRHFHDSAQIFPIMIELENDSNDQNKDNNAPWLVDWGSGGGFPGLVLAILSGKSVELVETNPHKANFLRDMVAAIHCDQVTIHQSKIALMQDKKSKFITARALAPLNDLLGMIALQKSQNNLKNNNKNSAKNKKIQFRGNFIFPKGKSWESEIKHAQEYWNFSFKTKQSLTDPQSTIIIIKEFHRVTG